jgi:ribosome-associated protein
MIQIHKSLSIPMREIQFVYGTSSGPGGQHANKVSTKATLLFSVSCSPTLSTYQQRRILKRLSTRINKEGVLRVTSSKHRSQRANRETVIDRFSTLLRDALASPKIRKKTKVSRSQKQKRLEDKKKRGETKRLRSKVEHHSN